MDLQIVKDAVKKSYMTRVWILDDTKMRLLESRCRNSSKTSGEEIKTADAFHRDQFGSHRDFEMICSFEDVLKIKTDNEKLRKLERRMTHK